ncbi:MAG: hypothetical protein K0S27_874 [Gammaproteobacteria bacterium]|jgi:hypothetical protein|nr:hypothetical protein [Gammaproteobacteria bacterium]
MKKVAAQVPHLFHKVGSVDTLKRLAQKSHFVWKRVRQSLKNKRNETLFQEAE